MIAEVVELVENLLWWSRRTSVDAPTLALMLAWEDRFRAQSRYFVRNGIPPLFAFTPEATLTPTIAPATGRAMLLSTDATIDASIATLDSFTYKAAIVVYNEQLPVVTAAGAMQAVRDVGAIKDYTVKSDFVLDYLKNHSAEQLGKDVDVVTKAKVRATLVQGYEETWTRAKVTKEIKGLFAGFSERSPQKHIRNRAELIAVNEMGTAYSQGALAAAIDIEATTSLAIEKSWALAAGPCALCALNAAQGWMELGKSFASGHDAPCAHPACRCSLLTRPKPEAIA